MIPMSSVVNALTNTEELSNEKLDKIESYINDQMKQSKIPGMSVVIVNGEETIFKKGFGYSDIQSDKRVTSETLFEMGSTSKAFTALAISQLEKEGLISLNDSVGKYIPWLNLTYNGEDINVTIEQVLHHTSGIPFKSIDKIPVSESESALEETVRTLVSTELTSKPGTSFEYATINYDILGLIISTISKQSYEDYIKKNILEPAGLNNTYLFRKDAAKGDMSKGYKIGFLKPRQYDAPMYRGNTPAGYFITNGNDLEKWLKIQLGTNTESKLDKEAIEKTHTPNALVNATSDGSAYAAGWYVNRSWGVIFHPGDNPNFSSSIVLKPNEKIGVAVLANMDSNFTQRIAAGIQSILADNEPVQNTRDSYISMDKLASTAAIVLIPVMIAITVLLIIAFVQILQGKRMLSFNGARSIIGYGAALVLILALEYCLYKVPYIINNGVTWRTVKVFAPNTLHIAALEISILIVLIFLYLVSINLFKRVDDKSYISIVILSIVSGLGNALVVFMVNESLNASNEYRLELVLTFLIGIVLYVVGQKIVRSKLIKITNKMVYDLRIDLLSKILGSSYEKLEKVESGKIQAAMNNDTELVSNFPNVIVTGATNLITLICCFIYLGFISIYGLLLSVAIIAAIASIYFIAGRRANRLWESTRDMQNVFFRYITDVIGGFKELSLNTSKSEDFKNDMEKVCYDFREKRSRAAIGFANVFIIGELLFTSAVGVVAFLFPVVFKQLQADSLRSFILVLLYMTGPVNALLNVIPGIVQIRISWRRVKLLIKELSELNDNQVEVLGDNKQKSELALQLNNVQYEYSNESGDNFKVGPINYTFNSGEIVFITGGNGSGKSTLAKLLTGLYSPQQGEILLNGVKTSSRDLGENYSTIFGDFYLFEKMYGIDYKSKEAEINKYLDILQIKDKVQISDGAFSTTKLSTGQRKRLALMISYLEDRPIYLFDEWAADQDPEFRKFFYRELLPELKNKGKCIIAITHDDRYFNTADRLIKMELGKIVDEEFEGGNSNIAATIEM
jgi:cyclic peptide transporter